MLFMMLKLPLSQSTTYNTAFEIAYEMRLYIEIDLIYSEEEIIFYSEE